MPHRGRRPLPVFRPAQQLHRARSTSTCVESTSFGVLREFLLVDNHVVHRGSRFRAGVLGARLGCAKGDGGGRRPRPSTATSPRRTCPRPAALPPRPTTAAPRNHRPRGRRAPAPRSRSPTSWNAGGRRVSTGSTTRLPARTWSSSSTSCPCSRKGDSPGANTPRHQPAEAHRFRPPRRPISRCRLRRCLRLTAALPPAEINPRVPAGATPTIHEPAAPSRRRHPAPS